MLIRLVLFLAAFFVAHSASAKPTLTVLTAYPEDVVAQFETAFEREHPDIDVQIIWRMPHDALPYLKQPRPSVYRDKLAHYPYLSISV